jgi:hypothetical protein
MIRDDLRDAVHPIDGRIRVGLSQHHDKQIGQHDDVLDVCLVLEAIRQSKVNEVAHCCGLPLCCTAI